MEITNLETLCKKITYTSFRTFKKKKKKFMRRFSTHKKPNKKYKHRMRRCISLKTYRNLNTLY